MPADAEHSIPSRISGSIIAGVPGVTRQTTRETSRIGTSVLVKRDSFMPDPTQEAPKKRSKKVNPNDPWNKRRCPPKKVHRMTKREIEIAKFKNIDFSGRDSEQNLTVQTLEFPDANIKRTDIDKRDPCGKRIMTKKTGHDFLSSSATGFRDAVFTVNMRPISCTSTSVPAKPPRGPKAKPRLVMENVDGLNSMEMEDSQHVPSLRAKTFKGDQWKKPCEASYVVGAPQRYIGRCPKDYQQLAKLSPVRQKFFLTQDPRKTHCLVNPSALRHKQLTEEQQFKLISKMVKHGDNVCASTGSESSDSHICEVIDLENPVNLDFQGMDYKNTYEKDEQEMQNHQTYWRVMRYMARRRTKKQNETKVEAELQAERLAIPAVFATKIKDQPVEEPPPEKEYKLAELFRSPDKPANKEKIAEEQTRREARYKDIYLRNKERIAQREQERKMVEAAAKEIEARTVAEMDLQRDVAKIDDDIERSFRKFEYIPPVIRKRKFFPKTLTETERLKSIMHKENCVRRDLAKVTQEFYLEKTGKLKKYPDVEHQMRCEDSIEGSAGTTPSEQSSDDEDYLKVGKIGDKFQLRGFHFKHGDGLRGKLHRHQIMEGQRTVKGCLTRDEWLNQLAPRKDPIKLDVERGIIKVLDPDDPNLDLFPPQPMLLHKHEQKSAIKEFIDKRLGLHYHRVLRKNLKLVKPRLKYHVKKFNLIRYVFSDKIIMPDGADGLDADMVDASKVETTLEYIALKNKVAKAKHLKKKLARMNLLGLPCVEAKQLREQSPCDVKEEELDLDWVPPQEIMTAPPSSSNEDEDDRMPGGRESIAGSRYAPINQHRKMPVSLIQEKHPKQSRDYASAPFNYGIKRSGMPYLKKAEQDNIGSHMKSGRKSLAFAPIEHAEKRKPSTSFNNAVKSSGMPHLMRDEQRNIDFRMTGGRDSFIDVPIDMRGNMPAPMFREKTLIMHPRRRRDYAAERVPSALFNEAIRNSGMPLLEKVEPDNIKFANVRTEKRPFTEKFEARHHHDHWDPTQVKTVHVHYQTKTVYPKTTVHELAERKPIVNFTKANPPCRKHINTDLTLPRYDFEKMIAEHLAATRVDTKDGAREIVQNKCVPYDFVFHSREPDELTNLDFPGRKQYLEFLRETREAIYETKDIEPGEERLLVDRKAVEAELEEDLKSIEECLTSLSSSDCTNLSRDSGSFLLLEDDTKIPLDYIRKPLVPFEEMRRSRFQAEVIDVDAEEENPYRMLPFSGQHKEQAVMLGPKDSFFTFTSRLRNGLRLRLEVPVPDMRSTLIGSGSKKYFGTVITDLDENYITEMNNRAPIKTFNFMTGVELMKVAMRLKYESLLIQGKMVRTKIYDTLNERHWQDMKNTKLLYEGLFAKWEKKEYNAAMTMVYQVKTYYEITDKMKQEYRELERNLTMLNMDIVFIEGHWIRCVMLQNFHYLLGDEEWRAENDWIHLAPVKKRGKFSIDLGAEADLETLVQETIAQEDEEDVEYELEPYDQSIAKRTIVNIRVRDKDDAWAIRDFYYNVYMQNLHPVLQVFPNADTFLQGIDNLKNKTFMLLLEMHYTLSVHTELQGRLETFMDWCANDLKEKQEYVARKSAKKFFMEDRAAEMEKRVRHFLDKPIKDSFADEEFNRLLAILAEVWRRVVPASIRGSSDVIPNATDMAAAISTVVVEILAKFEHLDIDKAREVEATLRKRRRYLEKLSAQAYQVERRIEMEMKKVRRNLEPPYKKPPRTGPLQRLYLRKRIKKVVVPPVVISENTRNFVRAFAEEGVVSAGFTQDSVMVLDNMQEQIVPFYFDHFLKINGYTPNYNFKTNIEARDGIEINRFRIREVLPDVLQKVDNWEQMHKKIMEENIQRNPKMYENVS